MKKLLSAIVALAFLASAVPAIAAEPPAGGSTASPSGEPTKPETKTKTTKKTTKKTKKAAAKKASKDEATKDQAAPPPAK